MTYTISFRGHCVFVWKYVDLSINWFSASFPYDCYYWMLQKSLFVTWMYVLTVISTFNLVLSATGTTDRNGHKTRGFTDSYDWLLVVLLLQLWNVLNFSFLSISLGFLATVTTNYVGHALLISSCFLCFPVGVFRLRCGSGECASTFTWWVASENALWCYLGNL